MYIGFCVLPIANAIFSKNLDNRTLKCYKSETTQKKLYKYVEFIARYIKGFMNFAVGSTVLEIQVHIYTKSKIATGQFCKKKPVLLDYYTFD